MSIYLPGEEHIEQIVIIHDIGTVTVRENRRARRIILRLDEAGAVVVTVPHRSFSEEAIAFVLERRAWIARERELRRKAPPPALPSEPPQIPFEHARTMLVSRLMELAERHRLMPCGVTVRRQRTVWGSCSATGRISLNGKAARLPAHLRDYVLLHELAHLRYRSHGVRFWRLLDRLIGGDARTLDRELRRWPLALL